MVAPDGKQAMLVQQLGRIGPLRPKNRVVMGPMGTNFGTTDGFSTERDKIYYAERARGGAAMIITEAVVVSGNARNHRASLCIFDDRFIPGLADLTKTIRHAGALVCGQLNHQMPAIGRALMPRPSFVLMDEPSLGLAPLVVENVHQAIDRIRREMGIGGILVEQNVAVALSVAARAYVLMRGAVVLDGDPKSFVASPQLKDAYLGMVSTDEKQGTS